MRVDEDRRIHSRLLSLSAVVLASFCFLATSTVFAQDDGDAGTLDDLSELNDQETVDEVVVTGSRIKRDTYSSVAPLQIITGEVSREIGAIDPSTILQDATTAGGNQVDITYQGFVTTNGPGSSTIDLRGLGAERTLVLINGRRASPVGVEGAPFAADLNMVPSGLIDRYEILLDGASSIYGSDAVAGVANIIMRKDFDGFEIEAFTTVPDYSGGVQNTLSASWGKNFDRGVIGVAVDASHLEPVDRNDRPWSKDCTSYREIDAQGNIYTDFIQYQVDYGMKTSPCTIGFGARRVFDNQAGLFGSLYYTGDTSNTGIPGFSEATLIGAPVDTTGNGVVDVDFTDYFITSNAGVEHLFPEMDRVSAMAYGDYTFAGEANITPYFELLYNKRESFAQSSPGSASSGINPLNIPGSNPYNPCNPDGLNGVDCGEAWDSIITNPNYIAGFGRNYEALCAQFGFSLEQCTPSLFGIFPGGPSGAISLEPQVSVIGHADTVETDIDQMRYVAGIRGDIPFLSAGTIENWSFDLAVVHSDSEGTSVRYGIRDDLLRHSVNTTVQDPATGAITCGDGTDGCVPVNMFAPSLYQSLTHNDFATQAERDYLFDVRSFVTEYKQTIYSILFTGDLFEMPAGTVSAAIGYDYRDDEINSIPNEVARDGLLVNFFKDLGATGSKTTKEWFAEVEVPLLANVPAFEELTLNFATRHTDDEFYGGAYTYSGKLLWRPVESLQIKGTVGTSYRAPNLRENFLRGTSGFLSYDDPCVTPETAIIPDLEGGFTYDPSGDTRTQAVLDNCFADGVNPEDLGINNSGNSFPRYGVEVLRGVGQEDIREEKSESFTAGFSWEQPIFESFGMNIGATYYDIRLRDEISQIGGQFSIDQCYSDPEGDSPYCRNIFRNFLGDGSQGDGLFRQINQQFLNKDALKARGVDINIAFDWPTEVFGKAVDFSADLTLNRKLEMTDIFIDPATLEASIDSDLGDFGYSEWAGHGIFRADVNDWRFTWSTRYISGVEADPDLVEQYPYENYITGNSFTCVGPDAGGADCRPVFFAENYFRHDVSVYYYGDVWTFGVGSRNVLNEKPPLVDPRDSVVFESFNVPIGAGYDMGGRAYFVNIAARFQ
jgi:iron complex outermembrane receptor protein